MLVLANFALAFGRQEYFALMFMGLSLIISLSGRALLRRAIISMSLGLTASLIGAEPAYGSGTFASPSAQST